MHVDQTALTISFQKQEHRKPASLEAIRGNENENIGRQTEDKRTEAEYELDREGRLSLIMVFERDCDINHHNWTGKRIKNAG